jgi:hypothetical protein
LTVPFGMWIPPVRVLESAEDAVKQRLRTWH